MNIKLILGIVLAGALCSQAYALQITNGKLISHKEWVTTGAKGHISAGYQSQPARESGSDVLPASVNAEIHSVSAAINNPVDVQNQSMIYILNAANLQRSYSYTMSTCAEMESSNDVECVHYTNTITLDPNGSFFDAVSPVLSMTYRTPGVFKTYADTTYEGNNSDSNTDNIFEYGASSSDADITVS